MRKNTSMKYQTIFQRLPWIEGENIKYSFVKICLETNKGLSCATSLFYEYLLENNYLKENKIISEFVELTRQHDTWEWKNIYNNEKSRELAILFDCLGTNGYINYMYNKLTTKKDFEFDSVEKMLIENKKEEIKEALNEYEKHIFNKEILGYKTSRDHAVFTDKTMILFDRNIACTYKKIHIIPYSSISTSAILFKPGRAEILMSMDSGYQMRIVFLNMNHVKKEHLKEVYKIMMKYAGKAF